MTFAYVASTLLSRPRTGSSRAWGEPTEAEAMAGQSDATARAIARERRYVEVEERVNATLEPPTLQEALAMLKRCPRRSGLPAMGSYFCECPACTPEEWGLND